MHVFANSDAIAIQNHSSDAPAPGTSGYTDPATQAATDPPLAVEVRRTSIICAARTKRVANPAAKKRGGAKAVKKLGGGRE